MLRTPNPSCSRLAEAQGLVLEVQVDLWFNRRGVTRHVKVSPEEAPRKVEEMADQGYELLAGHRRKTIFG